MFPRPVGFIKKIEGNYVYFFTNINIEDNEFYTLNPGIAHIKVINRKRVKGRYYVKGILYEKVSELHYIDFNETPIYRYARRKSDLGRSNNPNNNS